MATVQFYATKDATTRYTISSGASSGVGADFHNVVGRGPGDYIYRTAIQFDLSAFPAEAYTINSAVIKMQISPYLMGTLGLGYDVYTHGNEIDGTPTIKASMITKSWTEGTGNADAAGTWSTSAPTRWSTFASGGANTFTGVDTGVSGNSVIVSGVGGGGGVQGTTISIDVKNLILQWAPVSVNGGQGSTNYGCLIYATNESTNNQRVNFVSNNADPDEVGVYSFYPYIEVNYSVAPTPQPTATTNSPKGTSSAGIVNITNLSDAQIWTASSDYAQGEFRWSFTPSATYSPIASWQVVIYEGTSNSGTMVYDSGTVNDSAHIEDGYLETTSNATRPSWIPGGWLSGYNGLKNGVDYAWYVYVVDENGQDDWSGVARFKARWGQALYEFDAGASYASTSSWLVDYDTPPSNTQAVELYQATNVRSQAVITNITAASGTITVTCAGGHSFVSQDIITITGVAPDAYNLTNVTVNPTGLTATAFTITNGATGTFVTGTQGYATLVAYETRTATVSNVTAASGTVTYTTSSAHGFIAGQKVTITGVSPTAYNLANVTINSTGLTSTQFTVTNAATGTFVSGGKAVMHGRRGISAPITDISGNGSTITYTGANNFSAGQQVKISGSSLSAFNSSSAVIASATASDFTVSGSVSSTYTIASLTATGTAVTYTTTANHGFSVDQLVVVAGCTPSGYNTAATGSRITATTNTTFTIANATTGALTVAGTARVIPTGTVAESVIETSGGAISGQARYCHAHIRTSVNNASSSAQPILNNVKFTYLSSTQTPDYWTSSGPSGSTATLILDSDTRRFGTKSVKITSSTAGDAFAYPYRVSAGDDIAVVPNTIYTFSCYIKIGLLSGANNVRLRVYPGGTNDPASVAVLADSGPHTSFAADNEYWRRLSVTFTTGSATHTVRPMIYMPNSAGVANDYFWADGILFEEGTVVRSWTPGFVTSGVTFEGGGLNIDTSRGGVLRLRGSAAGARDQISVGSRGLLFGGDTSPIQVYSSTAGQLDIAGTASPSAISTSGNISTSGQLISSYGGTNAISLSSATTPGITFNTDTNLYRSAANTLYTDDALTVASTLTAANGFTATTGTVSLGGTPLSLAAFTLTGAITANSAQYIPENAVAYATYSNTSAASPNGINGSVGSTVTQLPLSVAAIEGGDSTYFGLASNQITVKSAGIYLITLNVKCGSNTLASNIMRTQIRKNTSTILVDKADYVPLGAANAGTTNQCVATLAANDVIDAAGAFASAETAGANKMVLDRISIVRIGTTQRTT